MDIFPKLPTTLFDIIYVDPPWDYKGQLQHNGTGGKDTGGASLHYPTLPLKDLKALNVLSIAAPDCLLFMWTTSPHLDQGIELGKAWGFSWATVAFVWDKMRVNPGFYTMSQCELCLLFKKGRIPSPRGARNIKQLIRAERNEHSAKPPEIKERIDEMFSKQRKIELFARSPENLKQNTGRWQHWGQEAKPIESAL